MVPENDIIRIDQAYTHDNKSGRYIVTSLCLVKIDGIWTDGVIYQTGESGIPFEIYTRTLKNFKAKFTMEPLPEDHHDTKVTTIRLDAYDRIAALQELTNKDDYQVLAAITEEHGELAGAMSIEDKLHGKSHKTCDEPSTHEAVDVVITALALFFQRGGTKEIMNMVMNNKLDKWERNIKYKGPHGEN